MPNGGVPIHMVLRPHQGEHVIYCLGSELSIFSREEWETSHSDGKAIIRLDEDEARVLETFLRYWLNHEGGGIAPKAGVDVTYAY